jgi:hypothetical protein
LGETSLDKDNITKMNLMGMETERKSLKWHFLEVQQDN